MYVTSESGKLAVFDLAWWLIRRRSVDMMKPDFRAEVENLFAAEIAEVTRKAPRQSPALAR